MTTLQKSVKSPFTAEKNKITIAELNSYLESIQSPLRAKLDGHDSMLIQSKSFKCWEQNPEWSKDINTLIEIQIFEDLNKELKGFPQNEESKLEDVLKKYNELQGLINKPEINAGKFDDARKQLAIQNEQAEQGNKKTIYQIYVHQLSKKTQKKEESDVIHAQEKGPEPKATKEQKKEQKQPQSAEHSEEVKQKDEAQLKPIPQSEPKAKEEMKEAGQAKKQELKNAQKQPDIKEQAAEKKQKETIKLTAKTVFQQLGKGESISIDQIEIINHELSSDKHTTLEQLNEYKQSQKKSLDKEITLQNFKQWRNRKQQSETKKVQLKAQVPDKDKKDVKQTKQVKKTKESKKQEQQAKKSTQPETKHAEKAETEQKPIQKKVESNWFVQIIDKYLTKSQDLPQLAKDYKNDCFSAHLRYVQNEAKCNTVNIEMKISSNCKEKLSFISSPEKENKKPISFIQIQSQTPEILKTQIDMIIHEQKLAGQVKTLVSNQANSKITYILFTNKAENEEKSTQKAKISESLQKLQGQGPQINIQLRACVKSDKKTHQLSLLSGFEASVKINADPKVIRQLKKNIEINHQQNRLFLLLALNKQSTLQFDCHHIPDIVKFYERIGVDKATKKIPRIQSNIADLIEVVLDSDEISNKSLFLQKIATLTSQISIVSLCRQKSDAFTSFRLSLTSKTLSIFMPE